MTWTHDCAKCRPLGEIKIDGTVYDLYVCEANAVPALGPSIIARFGDDGSEYLSAPAKIVEGSYLTSPEADRDEGTRAVVEAHTRWKDL